LDGLRGRGGREVALLDQRHRHAAQRQLSRDAGAGHPAADDDDVVFGVLQRPRTSVHRSEAPEPHRDLDHSFAPSGAERRRQTSPYCPATTAVNFGGAPRAIPAPRLARRRRWRG
jgi:hypothetical protein